MESSALLALDAHSNKVFWFLGDNGFKMSIIFCTISDKMLTSKAALDKIITKEQ
jgi:hypothetical protein